jgi:hypothetical protein
MLRALNQIRQQRATPGHVRIVATFKEAEEACSLVVVPVVLVVNVGADSAGRATVAQSQEELDVGVLVERVVLRREAPLFHHEEGRHQFGLPA